MNTRMKERADESDDCDWDVKEEDEVKETSDAGASRIWDGLKLLDISADCKPRMLKTQGRKRPVPVGE